MINYSQSHTQALFYWKPITWQINGLLPVTSHQLQHFLMIFGNSKKQLGFMRFRKEVKRTSRMTNRLLQWMRQIQLIVCFRPHLRHLFPVLGFIVHAHINFLIHMYVEDIAPICNKLLYFINKWYQSLSHDYRTILISWWNFHSQEYYWVLSSAAFNCLKANRDFIWWDNICSLETNFGCCHT